MTTAKEQRDAKARKRQKERRAEAQKVRSARTVRAKATPGRVAAWPITDAWISQDWYERERTLHAALVRGHGDGARAVLIVTVDCADAGLTTLQLRTGLSQGNVNALVADHAETQPMVAAEAEDVARLLHDGLAWRRDRGLPEVSGLESALAFLGDLDPDLSSVEVLFGFEDDEEDTVEVRPEGLVSRITRWVGLSR